MAKETDLFSIMPFLLKRDFLAEGWCSEIEANHDGCISIINDMEVQTKVMSICCKQFYRACIIFPDMPNKFIGTPFPYLVVHMKNLGKYTGIEIDVKTIDGVTRKLRTTMCQSVTRLLQNVCTLPLKMVDGWNNVVLDLRALCLRIWKLEYKYTLRLKIFASTRVQRVFFMRQLYQEYQLPDPYKVFSKEGFEPSVVRVLPKKN